MADWFYVPAGESESTGPVDEASLKQMFDGGTLSFETQVWQAGMGDWLLAQDVAVFAPPASVEEPTPTPAIDPLDFVLTPVVPEARQFEQPPAPAHPSAAGAPTKIVRPSVIAPLTPAPTASPDAFAFTPVATTPFAAPKQIVRPGTVTSSGPKMPPPPSQNLPSRPNFPPAPPSPVSFPPLPSPALTPASVSVAPPHAPPPPAATNAGPAAPTATTTSDGSRPPLQVPLWVKGAGALILVVVIISSLSLPFQLIAAIEFVRGKKAESEKNYAEALSDYQAALVHAPNSTIVITRLGVIGMRLGDAKTSDWALQKLKDMPASDGNVQGRLEILNTPEGKP